MLHPFLSPANILGLKDGIHFGAEPGHFRVLAGAQGLADQVAPGQEPRSGRGRGSTESREPVPLHAYGLSVS